MTPTSTVFALRSFGGPGAVHGGSLPASQCVLVLPNLHGATPPPLPIFSYGFVFGYIMSYVGAGATARRT